MVRKRNLDPSLLNWLMTLTGLGPGIGEVHYVVPVGSSTSKFYEWLKTDMRTLPANIHHSIAEGYNALTDYRNDILLVMPGAYLTTAELTWAKQHTHMLGLGGPNTNGDWSEPNVVMYTATITVASVLTMTGANCQFHNMVISNYGNNAACLTAALLSNYGCYFKNMAFQGNMTTNQNTTVAAASLYIDGSGMYPIFDDCVIGQDVWGERSGANSGQLRFTGTTQPNGGQFNRCRIPSRSVTATCAAVALPANGAIGRGWVWNNCIFSNEYATPFTNVNNVFYDNDLAGQSILLKDCVSVGYAEWQAGGAGVDRRIFSNMGVATAGGGIAIEPTTVIG